MSAAAMQHADPGWFRSLEADLRAFVRRRIASAADADDVMQEIWIRIVRGLPGLQDDAALFGWVYQIARHAIADYHRRPPREVPAPDLGATAADEPGDERRPAQALAAWLRLAIEGLPEPYRSTLRATEIEQRPHAEVAAQMGVSVSAVKSRVSRGRHKLRQALDRCCQVELDARGGVMGYRSRQCGCEQ